MAKVVGSQVQLDNGQMITPQTGGWYDGMQYWNGSLSAPGQINPQSNQAGAGQAVSKEVIAQTSPANVPYIQAQQQKANYTPTYNPTPAAPTTGAVTTPGTAGTSAIPQSGTINLPNMYESLYQSSGITALEAELSAKNRAYADAQRKINDNPYFSEATRVGRIDKLTKDYNNSIANLQKDVATKKADIETRLNLETKQFDINSQEAKMALDRFNTLLSAGALDSASGDDIANITRSTGISSAAIYSAIKARQDKNIETKVSQIDDGKNIYAVVINSKTGEVISKQPIGTSKPAAATQTQTKEQEYQTNRQNLVTSIKNYNDLESLIAAFYPALTIEEIYLLYNANSPFGKAKESLEEAKAFQFKEQSPTYQAAYGG
jgi:hypothetical protein